MLSGCRVITWLGVLEWIELSVNIEEGVLVSVVRPVAKGGAGVRKPSKSNLDRLVDEGAQGIGDPPP